MGLARVNIQLLHVQLLLPCLGGYRWGHAHALPMPPPTEAAAPMTAAPLRTPSVASSTLPSTLPSTL